MESVITLEITNSIMNTLQVLGLAYIAVLAKQHNGQV